MAVGGFLGQVAAVAEMRRSMLLHSLRKGQRRFDLAARAFLSLFFLALWLLISPGEGILAAQFARNGELKLLPVLLWQVVVVWQIVPILLSMRSNAGFSILLCFPVSFPGYLGLNLVFGVLELPTLLGGCMLAAVWIGLVIELPQLALPAGTVLLLFGLLNFVFARMVYAWLERWLAQRRTREILGTLTLFCFLGLQLLNPIVQRGTSWLGAAGMASSRLSLIGHWAMLLQKPLPPGAAAAAIEQAAAGRWTSVTLFSVELSAYLLLFTLLLALRLRGEYRGEHAAESGQSQTTARVRVGKQTVRASSAKHSVVAAILEKEWFYLRRSGVLLYSLAAPPFLVIFFMGSHAGMSQRFALPLGAAYAFLGLTRLISNSLGGEAAGLRVYFLSPTPLRTVFLAKNLFHTLVFLAEVAVVLGLLLVHLGRPDPVLLAVTLCWMLFALPAQLALGNLLSVTMGYRMTLTRLSREQGATGNGLLSLAMQLAILAAGAMVYLPLLRIGHAVLAVPVFLLMAASAAWFWWSGLARLEGKAFERRELLIANISR